MWSCVLNAPAWFLIKYIAFTSHACLVTICGLLCFYIWKKSCASCQYRDMAIRGLFQKEWQKSSHMRAQRSWCKMPHTMYLMKDKQEHWEHRFTMLKVFRFKTVTWNSHDYVWFVWFVDCMHSWKSNLHFVGDANTPMFHHLLADHRSPTKAKYQVHRI